MNLIGDPWIPVLDADGRTAIVGLGALYERAHEIRDLALQPPQRIAVMRLLLCITHAALDGPRDEDDWRTCEQRIVPHSLSYLEERHTRFELYGERPFLQIRALVPTDNATLDKLDLGLAAGNMATLFDHGAVPTGRAHTAATIALNLLTYQCFSPGGLIGQTKWGELPTDRSSAHAPCIEESALHAFLRGGCVLDTLHRNLVTRADVADPWGSAIWDVDLTSPQDTTAEALTTSFLGRLVPLARAVLLRPGARTCTLANGLAYPKVPAGREPYATVITKVRNRRPGPGYLSISLERHPWREAPSVLTMPTAEKPGGPLPFLHLLRSPHTGTVDIWLGGLAADKARLVDTAEWVFSIPMELIGEAQMTIYTAGVELASTGESQLRDAVRTWGQELRKSGKEISGPRSHAVRAYWGTLDAQYAVLVERACAQDSDPQSPILRPWRDILVAAMGDAYAHACSHTTPRQIQAFAKGQRVLYLPADASQEERSHE